MRLSGFLFAAVLVISVALLSQHSPAGSTSSGGVSSGGASHSGSSGASSGSSSMGSARMGSTVSPSSGGSASHGGSTIPSSHSSSSSSLKSSSKPSNEKESGRSFWHPFKKAPPVRSAAFPSQLHCRKEPCGFCPPGKARNSGGACIAPRTYACAVGQYWNGSSCYQYQFGDCSELARRLAEERLNMQGQIDPGESLRYQLLRNQYEQCLRRSRGAFGSYALNDGLLNDRLLFDTP